MTDYLGSIIFYAGILAIVAGLTAALGWPGLLIGGGAFLIAIVYASCIP